MKETLEIVKLIVQIALVAFVFFAVWKGDADRSDLIREYGAAMRFVATCDQVSPLEPVDDGPLPVAAEDASQVEEK
ncbi:MAG: hypothetical protein IKU86_10905 [Thermoguttaceae bacterium]|nr:hypothetical protein [Thermoguttaceae bacterium]